MILARVRARMKLENDEVKDEMKDEPVMPRTRHPYVRINLLSRPSTKWRLRKHSHDTQRPQ